MLAVSAIKDGIEDFNRHKMDKKVNNRLVEVYRADPVDGQKKWSTITWQEVTCTFLVCMCVCVCVFVCDYVISDQLTFASMSD